MTELTFTQAAVLQAVVRAGGARTATELAVPANRHPVQVAADLRWLWAHKLVTHVAAFAPTEEACRTVRIQPSTFTPRQRQLLSWLADQPGPRSGNEIAASLGLTRQGTTTIINTLTRLGRLVSCPAYTPTPRAEHALKVPRSGHPSTVGTPPLLPPKYRPGPGRAR